MQSSNFDNPRAVSPFGGHHSIFREAELAELPNCDHPQNEGITLEKTCTIDNSCPLTVADYCVCSAKIREGNLMIEEMTPEIRHTPPNSRAELVDNKDGIKMSAELSADVRHSTPNPITQVVDNRDGVKMIEKVTPELQFLLPKSSAQLLVNSIHVQSLNSVAPNFMQQGPSVPASGGPLRQHIPTEIVYMDGRTWRFRFIFSKILTKTDCRGTLNSTGIIYLPKKKVKDHFPYHFTNLEGVLIPFFDLNLHQTWDVTLKFGRRTRDRNYCLNQTKELSKAYALKEGNRLDIYKAESKSDARYALRVVK